MNFRWFIDVMDGKYITPSSGTNAGARRLIIRCPIRPLGLTRPFHGMPCFGNHDHFWTGSLLETDYLRQSYTNNVILLLGSKSRCGVNARIEFMGTIDGSTPYGTIMRRLGLLTNFIVGGVPTRRQLSLIPTATRLTTSNWMREFFNTTSKPVGHGFSQANITNSFACYSFEPKTNLPRSRSLCLDDTQTDQDYDAMDRRMGFRINWLLCHNWTRAGSRPKPQIALGACAILSWTACRENHQLGHLSTI